MPLWNRGSGGALHTMKACDQRVLQHFTGPKRSEISLASFSSSFFTSALCEEQILAKEDGWYLGMLSCKFAPRAHSVFSLTRSYRDPIRARYAQKSCSLQVYYLSSLFFHLSPFASVASPSPPSLPETARRFLSPARAGTDLEASKRRRTVS